jgi:hypothetical protein
MVEGIVLQVNETKGAESFYSTVTELENGKEVGGVLG